MACQKVSKQGGDDAKVNVLAKPPSPYIFFTLQVDSAWESSITSHQLAFHGRSLVLRPLPPPTWPGNEASTIQQYALRVAVGYLSGISTR